MSENKEGGAKMSKIIQKSFGRTKEKILQNLSKTENTVDVKFNDQVDLFNKQQLDAGRLHKDLRNYLHACKGMESASRALSDTIMSLYEPEWANRGEANELSDLLPSHWQQHESRLVEEALTPLQRYIQEFHNVKARIAKCGRKKVDYDSSRRAYQSAKEAKRVDAQRVARAQEHMDECRKTYEELYRELGHKLPALYHSRIGFYCDTFQSVFSSEAVLHSSLERECARLKTIAEGLAADMARQPPPPPLMGIHPPVGGGSDSGGGGDSEGDLHRDHFVNERDDHEQLEDEHEYQYVRPAASSPQSPPHDTAPAGATNGPTTASPAATAAVVINGTADGGSGPTLVDERRHSNVKQRSSDAGSDGQENRNSTGAGDVSRQQQTGSSSSSSTTPHTTTTSTYSPQADEDNAANDVAAAGTALMHVNGHHQNEQQRVSNSVPVPSSPQDRQPYPNLEQEGKPGQGEIRRGSGGPTTTTTDITNDEQPSTTANSTNYATVTSNMVLDSSRPWLKDVRYKVRAHHIYESKEEDELTLNVGDVVYVMDFEDPEEQDEGWLYGVRESDEKRGVFPANFTEPI